MSGLTQNLKREEETCSRNEYNLLRKMDCGEIEVQRTLYTMILLRKTQEFRRKMAESICRANHSRPKYCTGVQSPYTAMEIHNG